MVHALARARADRDQRHAAHLRQPFVQSGPDAVEKGTGLGRHIPLVDGDNQRAPFVQHTARDLEILVLQSLRRVEQQHHDFGEIDRALRVGDRQLFELVGHAGAFAHAGGVDQANRAQLAVGRVGPVPVHRDRVARDPRFRPGQQPIAAHHPVDEGGLAGVGSADNSQLQRPGLIPIRRVILRFRDERGQRLEQVRRPLAMLGADGDGLAQAERPGIEHARLAQRPFRLVGDQHQGDGGPSKPTRDLLVERGHAGPRVDHEQRCIGAFQAGFGLRAHPAGQAGGIVVLPPGGVDDGEAHPRKVRVAHPAIASHAGAVVDQRQPLADQAVEQRRFADIGPADDDDGGKRHRRVRRARPARPRPDPRTRLRPDPAA